MRDHKDPKGTPVSVLLATNAHRALADVLGANLTPGKAEALGMGWRVTVRLEPAGESRPAFDPQDLPSFWMTGAEKAIVEVLLADPRRMTITDLEEPVEAVLGRRVTEGAFKWVLSRLVHVGILNNDRAACPPGYQVTERFRGFLGS